MIVAHEADTLKSDAFGDSDPIEIRRVMEECLDDLPLTHELFNAMDAETQRICEWYQLLHETTSPTN